MKSIEIRGTNAHPGAPTNWDATRDGHCGILAVRVEHPGDSAMLCHSAWVPSAEELVRLNRGGHVVLTVCGWQVPVALKVEFPYPEAEEAIARTPLVDHPVNVQVDPAVAQQKLYDAAHRKRECHMCATVGRLGCPQHYWQR